MRRKPRVGLALGSGSARGWAHIGAIRALEERGIKADLVCGTSIGALVGAAYAAGELDRLEKWVSGLAWTTVVRLMDLTWRGGLIRGERLFSLFRTTFTERDIADLPVVFGAVATELATGREIWLRHGNVLDAARASAAAPGLFTPVVRDGTVLVDGGLVNPVPVSACRAMGADVIIAVNLNAQLVGRHLSRAGREEVAREAQTKQDRNLWRRMLESLSSGDGDNPSVFDVVTASVNILQDRLTRSRMAGDPPEITLLPVLEDFALMDFHRASECIDEGRRLVKEHEATLLALANP